MALRGASCTLGPSVEGDPVMLRSTVFASLFLVLPASAGTAVVEVLGTVASASVNSDELPRLSSRRALTTTCSA